MDYSAIVPPAPAAAPPEAPAPIASTSSAAMSVSSYVTSPVRAAMSLVFMPIAAEFVSMPLYRLAIAAVLSPASDSIMFA